VGLVKVVFATETLALGINMPARSVVLERLVKFNGEAHVDLTPGEYTQLTGRAGRRGIDVEGHAVVVWTPEPRPACTSPGWPPPAPTRCAPASGRRTTWPSTWCTRSGGTGRGASWSRRSPSSRPAMTCDRGDFGEYATLRRELSDVEAAAARERRRYRQEETAAVVTALRVGDILDIPSGRSRGLAVVLQPAEGNGRDLAPPVVLSESRQVRRLSVAELRRPPAVVGTVRVPRSFNAKVPAARRSLVAQMRAAAHRPEPDTAVVPSPPTRGGTDEQVQRLQETLRAHPCHGCPDRDEHARWAERRWALQREYDRIERSVERRSTSIANAFDRVCQVLDALGYLDGDTVTADGARLRGLFGELDLLAAESLRQGLWDGLGPAELAACASALTYQARGAEPVAAPHVPPGPVRAALEQMQEVWEDLHDLEGRYRLSYLRPPDPGFAHAAYRWAAGQGLAAVLVEVDLTPGDFVRAARQVLDVLDQVAAAAGSGPVHTAARAGADAMNRGVVCYESRSAS
jgi:ATP-dependent RNA helicase HelY